MKKTPLIRTLLSSLIILSFCACADKNVEQHTEYVVLANKSMQTDTEWQSVIQRIQELHAAPVIFYDSVPRELKDTLQHLFPRYVAIVEHPENLGKTFVMDLNRLSREMDEDIYADFLWGIITGYTPESALKMVNNQVEPLVVKSAVSTIMELESGKWFDRYAYVDDHKIGLFGEKKEGETSVTTGNVEETITLRSRACNDKNKKAETCERPHLLKKFYEIYKDYDADLVVTASHATENNLEMPASVGNIKAKDGELYADFANDPQPLHESGKRKVYLPIGNCLIGNVNNTPNSMAIAWMNSGNAATMIGYVVPTWHGRNGWGGLKYWLTTPGRLSLAEAFYLNQQDMLTQEAEWNPNILKHNYPFIEKDKTDKELLKEYFALEEPLFDQHGFFHDRDVLAYYGDPKWNVRLQTLENEMDYEVTTSQKRGKYILTIKTSPDFSLERMKGDKFKEEHVLDLPFSFFFPKRLNNPHLAEGQEWKVALDENFLLIYNADFQPNSSYTVTIDVD